MIKEEYQQLLVALVKRRILSQEQVQNFATQNEKAINSQGITQTLIWELGLDETQLDEIIAEEFNIPFIKSTESLNWVKVPDLPEEASTKYRFIPIILEDLEVTIAFVDPPTQRLKNLIESQVRREIVPVIISPSTFDKLITDKSKSVNKKIPSKFDFESLDVLTRGERWASSSEAAAYLPHANKVLSQLAESANNTKATAIHLEIIKDDFVNVKFRIDDILQRVVTLPSRYNPSIYQIIKQKAGIQDYKKNKIQKGFLKLKTKNSVLKADIHIMPGKYGEKITCKITGKLVEIFDTIDLGFSEHDMKIYEYIISQPASLIIFTGSENSGKFTTMFSTVKEIDTKNIQIASIESPIKIKTDIFTQTEITDKSEIDRLEGIKAISHHDVNIFILDEIQSQEEFDAIYELVIQGIKVLTTISAPDAFSAIFKLKNMGIDMNKFVDIANGIIAQKTVRKICHQCAIDYQPEEQNLEVVGLINLDSNQPLRKGEGCRECLGSGYSGTVPLYETLILNPKLKELILQNQTKEKMLQAAQINDFTTMKFDGVRKILRGITTIEEVLRVV